MVVLAARAPGIRRMWHLATGSLAFDEPSSGRLRLVRGGSSLRGHGPLAPAWLVTCAGLPAAGFAQAWRWPRGGASVVAPALAAP